MNVHSSVLESGYPSTLIMFNHGIGTVGMNLAVRDAPTGANLGNFYSSFIPGPLITAYPNQQLNLSEATMETVIASPTNTSIRGPLTPPSHHLNLSDEAALFNSSDNGQFRYFYQHLVTNRRPGVVADMTAMCALDGKSTASASADLRIGGLLSSLQPLGRSTLRVYNAGATAGPVRVRLFGNTDDQPLGAWTSPEIPAGAVREFDIATIETEATPNRTDAYIPPSLAKQTFYGAQIQTDIEGLVQVLVSHTGGAQTNASTCFEATGADAKTAIGVAASSRAAEGYASTLVVTNTGATAATAKLNITDARDGAQLGSFTTATIQAGGLIKLDARAIETAAGITADAARPQYVVTADEGFTGFLQHLFDNRLQGVVSDMTTACLM
jgi:hypothetical protein